MSKNLLCGLFILLGIIFITGVSVYGLNKQAEYYCLNEGSEDPNCKGWN